MPPQEKVDTTQGSSQSSRNQFLVQYPSLRDNRFKGINTWLEGKRLDDRAEGLWRVHDKLYDLTDFVDRHPGGKFWLEALRGTDITEAFESHHVDPNVAKILPKYYVRGAVGRRNAPYTFHEDGFYKTLKRKVWPILRASGTGPTLRMRVMADVMAVTYAVLLLGAGLTRSHTAAVLAGVVLPMLMGIAHNFFHQATNWRMYYFDLSPLSSMDWRISHAVSHHLYTNTFYDWEVAALEPFIYFLPDPKKSWFIKVTTPVTSHLVLGISFVLQMVRRGVAACVGLKVTRWENIIVLAELLLLTVLSGSFRTGFGLWLTVLCTAAFLFTYFSLAGTHHHPDCYHQHDVFRQHPDWGLCQLDAVRDRVEITGSLFLVSISFGDHTLHHLFPTVDHSKLPQLYPAFLETCKEFNVNFSFNRLGYLWMGMYTQMVSSTPNENNPGHKYPGEPLLPASVQALLHQDTQTKKSK